MELGSKVTSLKKWLISIIGNPYDGQALRKDIVAGILVGIIAIPLALAFAIASGVEPEMGIYTAALAGLIVALFGGSSVQIAGPTGAFVPILFSIVHGYGFEKLLLAGFLAGLILLVLGLLKAGDLIKYIPRTVTVGFTAGIAVVIFFSQIDVFLGLKDVIKHELFMENVFEIINHLDTVNIYSIITGIICLFFILFSYKFIPVIPGPLVGLAVSTFVANLVFGGQLETIGTKYGAIPNTLPSFHMPVLTIENIKLMIGPAFAIAMLGSIESLLSCVVADGMTGSRHNSNRELIGQGLANIVVPFFGGIPATGAIARTATNIRHGGSSPIAAIVHSLTVIIVVLAFAPLIVYIPLASIAVILMVVAWHMAGIKEFKHILNIQSGDSLVLIVTFFLSVFFNLTLAVEVGILLAAALFINNMSKNLSIEKVLPDPKDKKVSSDVVNPSHDCPQISIFTIDGALFFAAVHLFEQTLLDSIKSRPKVLILRMGNVSLIDSTAEASIASIVDHFQKVNGIILISGLKEQPKEMMQKTGLYDKIGQSNFFSRTGLAINYALTLVDKNECTNCSHQAFNECMNYSHISQVKHMLGQE